MGASPTSVGANSVARTRANVTGVGQDPPLDLRRQGGLVLGEVDVVLGVDLDHPHRALVAGDEVSPDGVVLDHQVASAQHHQERHLQPAGGGLHAGGEDRGALEESGGHLP